jgi:rhamnose utilization protein RhaD (predicted bifunctional aldolase and dehydrogenase)
VSAELEQIVALSRTLGDPALDLAILGEGNTSLRTGDGTMLVKASGASLGSVTEADFVELETAPLMALLVDPVGDDAAVSQAFAPVEARTGRRPSVEAMLHAVCLELGGAHVIGHTHPVPVLALQCSRHAESLATEMLFPDQIVVLGRRPLFVPYVDPGLALARRVRDDLRAHVSRHGESPKVIYLGNHGLFALGATPAGASPPSQPAARPAMVASNRPSTSQCKPSSASTGRLAKRWTSRTSRRPSWSRPAVTRPLVAPRSTAR